MTTRLLIEAHKDNKVIRNQEDYNELVSAIKQIEGYFFDILILPNKVKITHIGTRTFAANSKTNIDWIVNKCKYMIANNI